jgi:phosphate-selective porin OprO/OprP
MDANSHEGQAGAPTPVGGVRGGDQAILSLALNWYPSDRIRVMLNAMHVRVDRLNPAGPVDPEPFGPAPLTPPAGVQIGQSLDVVAMRVRYAF